MTQDITKNILGIRNLLREMQPLCFLTGIVLFLRHYTFVEILNVNCRELDIHVFIRIL